MQDKTFDVGDFINNQRIGKVQVMVMVLCATIMMIDGYDVFVMGFVLQPVAQSFGVAPAAITSVFVVQSLGIALGSWIVSPLADRYGRRRLLLASAVLFGLLTYWRRPRRREPVSEEQIALRFAAGLFYGSLMPNAIAITVEYAPERLRGTMNDVDVHRLHGRRRRGRCRCGLPGRCLWMAERVLGRRLGAIGVRGDSLFCAARIDSLLRPQE